MNKFQRKIKSLEAASDVVGTIEYRIDEETQQEEYYMKRAEDCRDEEGNLDPDNYYLGEASKHAEVKRIWEELIEYLEKKYLK